MNTNRRIAEWLGWEFYDNEEHPEYCWKDKDFNVYSGDFLHSNADAIGLLDVLVERGLNVQLQNLGIDVCNWQCSIWDNKELSICVLNKPTISEAVCAAIIQLIDKEAHHD